MHVTFFHKHDISYVCILEGSILVTRVVWYSIVYNKKNRLKLSSLKNYFYLLVISSTIVIFSTHAVKSTSLSENLEILVKTHKRLFASSADVSAAQEKIGVAKGGWFPTIDIVANIGRDNRNKPTGSDSTYLFSRNLDMSLTQKVWDFGSTNSSIQTAELTVDQAQAIHEGIKQDLIFEAIVAHLNIIRAHRIVEFAKGSVINIKRQTELENARVKRGAGLSTDLLQAKTQLAAALARQIQSEGTLNAALNKYRSIFGFLPENIASLTEPRLPLELLPKSLNDTLEIAFKSNHQLDAARLGAELARENIQKTKIDEFMPVVEASAEANLKKDSGGTLGSQQERMIKLEATYSFNLGATAINTLKASEQAHIATDNRYGETKDTTEEEARNGWDNLQTARQNTEHLHQQANIASEFLELARRGRQLGKSSLIDVLSSETTLINAASEAASADTDVAIAVYNLLNIIGAVSVDIVDNDKPQYYSQKGIPPNSQSTRPSPSAAEKENRQLRKENALLKKRNPTKANPLAENKQKSLSQSNPRKVISAASGTGFSVSFDGHIITNNHVVEGCQKIKIHYKGKTIPATVVAFDPKNDLALIKGNFRPSSVFSLSTKKPELLQDIYVAGYPFGRKISTTIKVTKGIISSLTGVGNNFSNLQIDAALQPGNSGGPILDINGNVVGVAVAKLDIKKILENYGVIPENTNFGIKSSVVRSILESSNVSLPSHSIKSISKSDLGKKISDGTYHLSCWMTTAQIEKMKSKKVVFQNLN